MPQSGQLLLFLSEERWPSASEEVSERAGDDRAEQSEDAGDNAGDEDLDDDMLRSKGFDC